MVPYSFSHPNGRRSTTATVRRAKFAHHSPDRFALRHVHRPSHSQIPVSPHAMIYIYSVLLTERKILSPHSVNLPEALQRRLMVSGCKVRTGIVDSHCQTLQIHPFGHLRDLAQYIGLPWLCSICESSTC